MDTRGLLAWFLVAALGLLGGAACDDGGTSGPSDGGLDDSSDEASDEVPVETEDESDVQLDCPATLGTGSLSGTVEGQVLSATHAGAAEFSVLGLNGYIIAFAATGGTCADGATLLSDAPVALQLCNLTPGDHPVGESCIPDGGGMSISASIKLQRHGDDVSADSGTITILEFDPACGGRVRGSFTADFAGQPASGTFDTVSCGSVAR